MGSTLYKRKAPLIVFLVPAFAFLILFLYYPFVQNIINSFCHITGLGTPAQGINQPWYINYQTLFTDPKLHTALKNTVILTICTVIFQVGIALILALLVDSIRVGAQLFRTLYFFPIVISATALGLMFNLIFLYNGGMVNQLLTNMGIIAENIDWKDQAHFLFTMLTPVMWQYVGFYFVILVTGLNNIPEELYEAASLDGATGLARVRYICSLSGRDWLPRPHGLYGEGGETSRPGAFSGSCDTVPAHPDSHGRSGWVPWHPASTVGCFGRPPSPHPRGWADHRRRHSRPDRP